MAQDQGHAVGAVPASPANLPSANPRPSRWNTPGMRLFIAIIIGTVLMVPLMMTYALIWDRQQQSDTARRSIAQGWGGTQVFSGPVIALPYSVRVVEKVDVDGRETERTRDETRTLYLSPTSNSAEVTLTPERRKRKIYETVVYSSSVKGKATFALPDNLQKLGVERGAINFANAEVRIGVSDPRGLTGGNTLAVNGAPVPLLPGKGLDTSGARGFHAFASWDGTGPLTVDYVIAVRGMDAFVMVPRGIDSRFKVTSPWASPKFGGDFLPQTRTVSAKGFTASYAVPNLALGHPQIMDEDLSMPEINHNLDYDGSERLETVDIAAAPANGSVGGGGQAQGISISLIDPVNLYAQVDRAVKYGFLFIGFTFATLFMFDVVAGARVAPAEYFLTGVALVLFFTLLLAFAEVIGFTPAYLLASVAIIGLIVAYSAAVLKSWRRARMLGAVLAGLYAVLYVLLNLEAYSLLIGSVLTFAALATIMYLTRNVQWGGNRAAAN